MIILKIISNMKTAAINIFRSVAVAVAAFAGLTVVAQTPAQTTALSALLSPAAAAVANTISADARKRMPVEVNASDLLSKVYGVAECQLDSAACIGKVVDLTGMTPVADEYGHWLDSVDGFRLNYYGLTPEVSSMARFNDGGVGEFAFFFIFPYGEGERAWANRRQAEFCGLLLQELHDLGLDVDAEAAGLPSAYFTLNTRRDGRPVDILLREDTDRFVLALHVENKN